jgi:hypothetical protein
MPAAPVVSPRRLPATVIALALIVCSTHTSYGQAAALRERLVKAKSLNCTFPVVATGTWKDGAPSGEVAQASLKVSFTSVNVEEGTADAESAFGGGFIVVRQSNDYLHLMQMHGSGPLYTTTVLARETKEGRMMAIHTRHEYTDVRLPGFTSRPEMYLGECTIGN